MLLPDKSRISSDQRLKKASDGRYVRLGMRDKYKFCINPFFKKIFDGRLGKRLP
jgi:hypothetical protein